MNKTKSMILNLEDFLLSGQIFGLKKGISLNQIDRECLISSNLRNKIGEVEFFEFHKDDVTISFGVDTKNIVSFVMVYVSKKNKKVKFEIAQGNISLNTSSLSEILEYLNKRNVDWRFKEVLGKVAVIEVKSEVPVEIVYSMEKGEEGVYSVQSR